MSTTAPQKVQDTTSQKEQTTGRERDANASKDMNAGREQNASKDMNAGREQNADRDMNPGRGQNANKDREQTTGRGQNGGREQNAAREIKQEMADSAQSMQELVKELAKVTTQGGEEIFRIQSEACVESISETIGSLTPAGSPKIPLSMLWELPNQYKSQSNRMVKAWIDYLSVMARIQQQQLELLGPTLHRNIENTTHTMSQLNSVLSSRRGPNEVINFADRRGASSMGQRQQRDEPQYRETSGRDTSNRGASNEFAESEGEQGYGGSQRSNRQAAG